MAARRPKGEQERIDRLTRRLVPQLVTTGFSYAVAVADCGPTDLPAMAVYLVDAHDDTIPPKRTYIHAKVNIDPVDLSEESVQWFSGGAGLGSAELCSGRSCHAINAGRIDFGVVA